MSSFLLTIEVVLVQQGGIGRAGPRWGSAVGLAREAMSALAFPNRKNGTDGSIVYQKMLGSHGRSLAISAGPQECLEYFIGSRVAYWQQLLNEDSRDSDSAPENMSQKFDISFIYPIHIRTERAS